MAGSSVSEVVRVVEDRKQLVVLSLRERIVLVIVALAQAIVGPSQTANVVLTRSTTAACRNFEIDAPFSIELRASG